VTIANRGKKRFLAYRHRRHLLAIVAALRPAVVAALRAVVVAIAVVTVVAAASAAVIVEVVVLVVRDSTRQTLNIQF
jgi:hypothetical protein